MRQDIMHSCMFKKHSTVQGDASFLPIQNTHHLCIFGSFLLWHNQPSPLSEAFYLSMWLLSSHVFIFFKFWHFHTYSSCELMLLREPCVIQTVLLKINTVRSLVKKTCSCDELSEHASWEKEKCEVVTIIKRKVWKNLVTSNMNTIHLNCLSLLLSGFPWLVACHFFFSVVLLL